jgi:hypothetical protein
VRIRVGKPVELLGDDLDEDTKRIMSAIVDLLPAAARRRRKPTADELARSYPPGHKGGTEEAKRRPGTD